LEELRRSRSSEEAFWRRRLSGGGGEGEEEGERGRTIYYTNMSGEGQEQEQEQESGLLYYTGRPTGGRPLDENTQRDFLECLK